MTLVDRIRSGLRRHVPQAVRRMVAQVRRRANDARAARHYQFASEQVGAVPAPFVCVADVTQPIRRTAHFEGKMHNIGLAVARLDHVCLRSGQAVSFWRAVGLPTAKNGFQLGRGIVADRLSADVGGGLCQIASLLYELALRGGCVVIERHAHSRDLYSEDNRFTPLGLDAAVAWGFKDVRIANPHAARLVFRFEAIGETLRGRLFSEAPLSGLEFELDRRDEGARRIAEVNTRDRDGRVARVSCDTYVIDPT